MDQKLHNEMLAGTLRAGGQFKRAAAVEKAAGRSRPLSLAAADSPAADLDEALGKSASPTEQQSEILLAMRGELIAAARVAYGANPPASARERIGKWAAGHLGELGRVLRMTLDIAAETEEVLRALYGDSQPAEPTPAPAASVGAVVASQNRGGPIVIDMYTGRAMGRLIALTT